MGRERIYASFECPDCGGALPDEVGVQECECGYSVETFDPDPEFADA